MARTKPDTFAVRLNRLREAAGLSQSALAERAGLSQAVISRLEAGSRQPTWKTVQALAAALGCTLADFQARR